MAVPVLKHHFCRRGDGKSKSGSGPKAHAHAAYVSGTKLDDGHGNTADFTPKGGILHAALWVPAGSPDWAKDRGQLWRSLEAREDKTTRHAIAILAHKFIGALPCELSLEENIRYAKDFVREQFTRKGYAADWAIHAPDPGSDDRNFHLHIMVPLRKLENGDWAKTKDRFPQNSPALSQYIRGKQEAFFEMQNRYLKKNGIHVHIRRQNGKWTVVKGPMPAAMESASRPTGNRASTFTGTVMAAMHGGNGFVMQPVARPSQAAMQGGSGISGGISETPVKTMHRAALNLTIPSRLSTGNANFKTNSGTKGWPPAALADWAAWGHKAPARFFQLWPELASGNVTPAGGHNL